MPDEPLATAAVALWCFGTALAGGVAGLVLGNIRLPVILLAASGPAAGAGANLGISAVAATAAATGHVRAGRVNWRLVRWMAPPSVVGALAGSSLAGALPDDLLLAIIGLALLYFGVDILFDRGRPDAVPRSEPDLRAAVISGAMIGVLGGLVGLILGTLRLPALLRQVGESPQRAVGTNLVVGVCVGVAGVIGHLPSGVDVALLGVGAAASVPGAVIGARLTGRLSPASLLRTIGVILVLVALATLARAVL